MPNCCVTGCNNHSSKNKKGDGITYHTFPIRIHAVNEKWIKAIRACRNEPTWTPTLRSVVCSAHFDEKDFYRTKQGYRRVLRLGYPKHLPAGPNQTANTDLLETNHLLSGSDQSHTADNDIMTETKELSGETDQSANTGLIEFEIEPKREPATPDESIVIHIDPLHVYNSQSQASATPVLSATPVSNMEQNVSNRKVRKKKDVANREKVSLTEKYVPNVQVNVSSVDEDASNTEEDDSYDETMSDTPTKYRLTQRVLRLERQKKQMRLKIKTLNQKVRRLEKRNTSLIEMLNKLSKAKYKQEK